MSKLLKGLLAALLLPLLFACRPKESAERDELTEKIDSLEWLCKHQRRELAELNDIANIVSATLDSIDTGQRVYMTDRDVETNRRLNRQQIKANAEAYKEMVDRQRQRIEQLERQLAANSTTGELNDFQKIIANLKQQLDEKDRQIHNLMAQLNSSRATIAHLQTALNEAADVNSALTEMNEALTVAVDTQNEIINEAYVLVAHKTDLKDMGLLKGGFLQKSRLEISNINKRMFTAVDSRTFRSIDIPGRKPRVLTPQPKGSYNLVKLSESSYRLDITDPGLFWSVMDYLIIEYN